jgi:hypothetical protein
MSKKGYLFISAIFILAGIVSIGYYFTNTKAHGKYGEELIANSTIPLKADLSKFLSNVDKSIFSFNQEIQLTNQSGLNPNRIDTIANSILGSDSYLKGVVFFTEHLKYVFLKDGDTRITTFALKKDSLLNWKRLNKDLKQISEWTDTYNFFLNKENRYILENAPKQDGKVKWLKLRSEIPGRKDLILQIHQLKTHDGHDIYVSYVFQTSDFSGFFLKKLSMKNPMVTILTRSGDVFTPVAIDDSVVISRIAKEENEVKKIFTTWQTTMNHTPHSFSFEMDNEVYWTRVDSLHNRLGIEAFSLTVSEQNLSAFYSEITILFVYAGGALIFLGLVILLLMWFRTKSSKLEEGELPERHSIEEMNELIQQGESESVEFKSSLRYDYHQEKENKALEDVIIKSIAAFSNAKGGTLFIGIDDDQNILGLENDYSTLKRKDVDYFELHLRKLIKNQFGINFSNNRLIVQFPELDGKTICVIQITTAKKPIYVKVKSKQGQIMEKFYVRNGNSSQEITSLKEMEEYIRTRFER